MLEYFCESSQLICTIVGGLASISKWYRHREIITSEDDLFSQTIVTLNKTTATSQVVLSSGSNSNFWVYLLVKLQMELEELLIQLYN